MPTSRLPIQDILKAIAIMAVVYAHCLQHLGMGVYLHHPLFKAIYAFHMPLFMTISGYFASSALQKVWMPMMADKAIRLLLPCVTAAATTLVINRITEYSGSQGWMEFVNNLWYLKSLFLCLCIAKCGLGICKGSVHCAVPLTLLVAMPLYLWHVNFMLPFFWMGYLWRKYPRWMESRPVMLCAVSLLLFIVLWPSWDGRHTTYITPFQLVDFHPFRWTGMVNLTSYLLRISVGATSTLCVISFLISLRRHIRHSGICQQMGRHTLEYYTLHSLFIQTGLLQCCAIPYQPGWYECGYCVAFSLLLLLLCECMRRLFRHSRWLSLLWFGTVPIAGDYQNYPQRRWH